jgi:hypothetical protein
MKLEGAATEGGKSFHQGGTEFAEFGEILIKKLFTLRPPRLGGEPSETFESFVRSLENTCMGRVSTMKRSPGFRHTRESGYPG